MVVLVSSRASLNDLLAEPLFSVLVLAGAGSGTARDVHDLAEDAFENHQTWRKTALVTDVGLLTAAERAAWVDQADTYAMLARDPNGSGRSVAGRGPLADLLREDGEPSIRALRGLFRTGD